MLKIQTHIANHGLKKTVDKFKLNLKDLGHKIMLKYSQLDSPSQNIEVHEARGLILEKDTWKVISMPFQRFFSHNDVLSPKLNWAQTHVMEKRDGTLIQVYFDYVINEWCVNTMFSECMEEISYKGVFSGISYKTMFFEVMAKYDTSFDNFDKSFTYIFELTSLYNKVVVSYETTDMHLLGARNLNTLLEVNYGQLLNISSYINIPLCKTYQFNSLSECLKSFDGMSFNFEGYVAWDGYGRIKIKNPSYVAVHLTKKKSTDLLDLTKPYIFLDIVKQNEIDEFISSFPHAKPLIESLNSKYNKLLNGLHKASELIQPPKNISTQEKKLFASSVFTTLADNKLDQSLSSIFFLMNDGKADSINDYIRQFDNKKLYNLLK